MQQPADAVEIGLERAAVVQLVDDRLREERRRDVGRDRTVVEARTEILRDDEPAHAQTGRDRLRERRRERDAIAAVELVQQRRRFAFVADAAVRIVLEDVETVLGGELDAAGACARRRASGRSGSGTWESCRGTRPRRPCAARPRARRGRDPRRPSAARRPRPPASRAASAAGRRSAPRRAPGPASAASWAALKNTNPCSPPVVTNTRPGSTPCRAASSSRSGP